jgi:hypothetical protein
LNDGSGSDVVPSLNESLSQGEFNKRKSGRGDILAKICPLPAGRNKKLPGAPTGIPDGFNEKLLTGSGLTCQKRVSNQRFITGDL